MYNSSFTDLMWQAGKVLLWGMAGFTICFLLVFGRRILYNLRHDDLGNPLDNLLFADWWKCRISSLIGPGLILFVTFLLVISLIVTHC